MASVTTRGVPLGRRLLATSASGAGSSSPSFFQRLRKTFGGRGDEETAPAAAPAAAAADGDATPTLAAGVVADKAASASAAATATATAKSAVHRLPKGRRSAIRYEEQQAKIVAKLKRQAPPPWDLGSKTVQDYVLQALEELSPGASTDTMKALALPLGDTHDLKFKLLATCASNFKLDVPNAALPSIHTVGQAVSFFEAQQDLKSKSTIRTTAQLLRTMDLPPNFKVV